MKFFATLFAVLTVAALIAAIWFPQHLGQLFLTAAVCFLAALIFAAAITIKADAKQLTK